MLTRFRSKFAPAEAALLDNITAFYPCVGVDMDGDYVPNFADPNSVVRPLVSPSKYLDHELL